MDYLIDEFSGHTFVKHVNNFQPNLFTESKQEFTELEKKIIVLAVNQIGHMSLRGEITAGHDVILNIPFTALRKDHYKMIADAALALQGKRLLYRNDKIEELDSIIPFPRVKIMLVDNVKMMRLYMYSPVVPFFAEMGKRYTKYEMDIMLSLSSVYAQRVYEIVCMYHNTGRNQFSYTVDKLIEMLNCPESYTYNELRRFALLIAQRELQEKANLRIEWTPTKKISKRIIELTFEIKTPMQLAAEEVRQDQQQINTMPHHELIPLAYQVMAMYDLKANQKDEIVQDPEKLETFFRLHSEFENGMRPGVQSRTKYMAKSLGLNKLKAPKVGKTAAAAAQLSLLSLLPTTPSIRTGGEARSIGTLLGGMGPSSELDK